MPANLEFSAVATGLEKVSFHSNPKERQCQIMFKLPYNCTHLTHQQNNDHKSPSEVSTGREPKTSRCSSWIQKRQRNQRSNCQHHQIIEKAREFQKNICFCIIDYVKAFDCVGHNKLQKILKEMGIPDHLTCLLRNLYAGQEATIRSRYGTIGWFKIGKVLKAAYCHPAYLSYMQSTS